MQSGNGFNNGTSVLLAGNSPRTRFVLGPPSLRLSRSARATGDGDETQPESSTSSSSSSSERSNIVAAPKVKKPQPQFRKPAGTGFGDSAKRSSSKKSSREKSLPAESKTSAAPARSTSTSSPGVRRRPAPSEPLIRPVVDPVKQRNETIAEVVLLTFLTLVVIEGIALAASGFLPDQWDDFLVKYIYPSFTPTIAVFVASAVGYGFYKYLGAPKKQ